MISDRGGAARGRTALRLPGVEPARACETHELVQPIGFGARHGAAEWRDAVIPPPLVVELRRRPLVDLDDEIVVQHPLNRAIEGAWTEAHLAVGARQHFLDDAVAVAILVGEGHQDVEHGRWQRQERIDASGLSHGTYYIHSGYTCRGYRRQRGAKRSLELLRHEVTQGGDI